MRIVILSLIMGLALASCAPQPAPVSTSTPIPTDVPVLHAPEIRFALIGQPQDINVWQLFDESGASYVNYAVRSEYWPRLYHLAPPEFDFQPLAADGMPSAVIQEGNGYSATVKLRADLKWTDGKPFTADDVAFTLNSSLNYELGYDWASYYSKDVLDRVETIDPLTVKFYFKQKPNVEIWQYGILQGTVLQKAFWESKISDAAALLPDETLNADIEYSTKYLATVQSSVDELTAQVNNLLFNGQENRELSGELVKRQGELGYANNTLNKLLNERTVKIESAHQALYAADDTGEPTLGTWMPAGKQNNVWVNKVNPDFPFVQPHFDRVVYTVFENEASALAAFENDEVDVVLSPNGLDTQELTTASSTNRSRFLVFNQNNIVLAEINLRMALACVINLDEIGLFRGQFVLNKALENNEDTLPCDGLFTEARIEKAIEILKKSGYSWGQEPNATQSGSGMKLPGGTEFPRITLLSTSADVDPDRAALAAFIEQQALHLGIPIDVELTDLASLQYAVYSSEKYDMAIFGWRLSEYPGYLCEWFGAGGQFEYDSGRLKSTCEALAVESDLEATRSHVFEVQSILMEDLPFIPLYVAARYDAFQNVAYPFENGVGDLYGAPSDALPAP